ncbi:MAG: porin [Kaistella sp.]
MKKYIMALATCTLSLGMYAQQNPTTIPAEEKINNLEKKNEQLNIFFNFQSSFDVISNSLTDQTEVGFKARQLRLEIKGDLTDKIFYRFRHRLNKATNAQSLDNLAKATDIMYAGYKFNDQFTIVAGKQSQAWGSFEFDINPMNIYEYSDFIENMDNFMLGANFIYQATPTQELQLQITDTRNSKMEDIYGDLSSQGIEASASPLTYILNWNGSFLNNQFQTRWAYGIQTQAKDKYSNMITIGNKLNLKQFQLAFDYLRADEDIDRLGYATMDGADYLAAHGLTVFEDVTYNTFILKGEYQPTPKWNIFAKGTYETTSVNDVANYDDNFRKAYGYSGGVEYLPFDHQDLRLFLAYIGRKYEFNKALPTLTDYNTNRVSLGMMYRIKAF